MKKQRLLFTLLSLVPLLGALVYMIYCAVNKINMGPGYAIAICLSLFLYWLVRDVVMPRRTGELEGKTQEQIQAYWKMTLLELAGFGGLAYFALALSQNTGIYGALVFAGTTMLKRRQREIFEGTAEASPEDETPEEDSAGKNSTKEDGTEETPKDPPAKLPAGRREAGEPLSVHERMARLMQQTPDEDSEEAGEASPEAAGDVPPETTGEAASPAGETPEAAGNLAPETTGEAASPAGETPEAAGNLAPEAAGEDIQQEA